MSLKILAISRAPKFSPGNVENDVAILREVADCLSREGYNLKLISEEEFLKFPTDCKVIINMCRGEDSVRKLRQLEKEGCIVINSAQGIENSRRKNMTRLMERATIPSADNILMSRENLSVIPGDENWSPSVKRLLEKHEIEKCWIKKGDGYTTDKNDICFCNSPAEVEAALREMFERGEEGAILSRHIEGDLVKFYGIAGQPYFHWYYPEGGQNKFDVKELEATSRMLAKIFGLTIYGGDCIVREDGSYAVIDFNDWPSFKVCRKEAAHHITAAIISEIKTRLP